MGNAVAAAVSRAYTIYLAYLYTPAWIVPPASSRLVETFTSLIFRSETPPQPSISLATVSSLPAVSLNLRTQHHTRASQTGLFEQCLTSPISPTFHFPPPPPPPPISPTPPLHNLYPHTSPYRASLMARLFRFSKSIVEMVWVVGSEVEGRRVCVIGCLRWSFAGLVSFWAIS